MAKAIASGRPFGRGEGGQSRDERDGETEEVLAAHLSVIRWYQEKQRDVGEPAVGQRAVGDGGAQDEAERHETLEQKR